MDRHDLVHAQLLRVPAHDALAWRCVEAEGLHAAVLIDGDMTVLPHDLRKVLLPDLARAPSDFGHLILADFELPLDEISRHFSSSDEYGSSDGGSTAGDNGGLDR